MSDTFFKNIHISNFKSLKDVTLSDCKRINLLIGKPNVGKSNILEAIGLFSLPFFVNPYQKVTNLIRFDDSLGLFFDGEISNDILVETDAGNSCSITYKNNVNQRESIFIAITNSDGYKDNYVYGNISGSKILFFEKKTSLLPSASNVKYYRFRQDLFESDEEGYKDEQLNCSYLIPSKGVNLVKIIQNNKELKKDLVALFLEYDLRLLFDKGTNSLRVVKETKDGEIFSLPYNSIADTLQRVIFFKTAIASNKNSILLFEEPEAHCFPPYIAHFTQDVINSETNQFFIATHSPYVLNDFLEYQRDDVAIFMADFKDGQTVIYRLTDDEVNEVYDYGIDVFFNYERFTQHG